MNILLTGGTGLIGRALCRRWLADGHRLWVWSRSPQRVAQLCGAEVRRRQPAAARCGSAGCRGELAGAPIADRPWTKARKSLLWDSRVRLTEELVEWLGRREQKPALLISGSAVGWYGDGGEHRLTEADQPVTADFASQLCNAWEERASEAAVLGIRVVLIRTGLVLARDGGFLQRLLPAFRLGLGGRLGNGRQWMPWIHIEDQIGLIDFLLQPAASGPYNACAPTPVRNLSSLAAFPAACIDRLCCRFRQRCSPLLGELAGLLLGGQHAQPQRCRRRATAFASPI